MCFDQERSLVFADKLLEYGGAVAARDAVILCKTRGMHRQRTSGLAWLSLSLRNG